MESADTLNSNSLAYPATVKNTCLFFKPLISLWYFFLIEAQADLGL